MNKFKSLKEVRIALKTLDTNPKTGAVESKVIYLPDFLQVFKDLQSAKEGLHDVLHDSKIHKDIRVKILKDQKLNQIYTELTNIFNKYRTHIRKTYPEEYNKIKSRS